MVSYATSKNFVQLANTYEGKFNLETTSGKADFDMMPPYDLEDPELRRRRRKAVYSYSLNSKGAHGHIWWDEVDGGKGTGSVEVKSWFSAKLQV